MSELSPAAQAVLDAYRDADIDDAVTAAAVLRAAVDEVIPPVPPPCADFDEYAQGFQAAHIRYRNRLLAIADELDAQ